MAPFEEPTVKFPAEEFAKREEQKSLANDLNRLTLIVSGLPYIQIQNLPIRLLI